MNNQALGFFCKPKFQITDLKEKNEIIYSGLLNDVDIYIRADGLIIIELHNSDIKENENDEDLFIKKLNNSLIYVYYANVIYLLFKNSYDKIVKMKNLSIAPLDLYEIVGEESIVVQKINDIWEISSMKADAYGRISYNSSCWFPSRFEFQISKIDILTLDEILDDFNNNLEKIDGNKDACQILLLLQKSYMAMINGQADISIILSWTVIERVINNFWDDLLEKKVTKKRKKSIIGIKEYTASVKTNELVLNDIITEKMAEEIDRVRKNRNKIMHGDYNMFETSGKINGRYDAIMPIICDSITVACYCIKLYYEIELQINNSLNLQIY